MKVYLAVGHGIQPNGVYDPGAVRAGVYSEQSAGDIIVETAAEILRRNGITVKDEARKDDPNWVGTAKQANEWGADLTVAVHHDWTGGVDGGHGFYYAEGNNGQRAGKAILQELERTGFNVVWSWFRERPELGLLRSTNHDTFLFEAGRIGDHTLDTPAELEKMGGALARGIMQYLGVTPQGGDDMAVSDWARSAWDWAKSKGLINDKTDPKDSVNKEELMTFFKRAADKKVFAVAHTHPSEGGATVEEVVDELIRRLQS